MKIQNVRSHILVFQIALMSKNNISAFSMERFWEISVPFFNQTNKDRNL